MCKTVRKITLRQGGPSGVFIGVIKRGSNFPEKIVSGGDENRPARQKVSSAWLA